MTHARESTIIAAPRPHRPWRLWAARAGWLFIFGFVTFVLVAGAPMALVSQRQDWQFLEAMPLVRFVMSGSTFAGLLVSLRLVSLLVFYTVALLIARRKWDDWFALFVSTALLMAVYGFVGNIITLDSVIPDGLQSIAPALTIAMMLVFIFSWLLLFFLLPDGHFAPRWAAWFTLLPVPATILLVVSDNFSQFIPPQVRTAVENMAWGAFMTSLLLAILVGLCAQVYRYRRVATPIQRQQMKWLLVGLGAQPLFILISVFGLGAQPLFILISVFGLSPPLGAAWSGLFSLLFGLFAITLLPVTIGMAVFRRRLWDVDPLLNRAIVYGGLTILVIALYAVIVGSLSTLFQPENSLLLSILLTGLIAVMLNPLRLRLQHAINRLMYGDRDDPITVISDLGRQLETAAAPGESLNLLVETIGRSLKLPYVAITTRDGDRDQTVVASGNAQSDLLRLPLIYQSRQVGDLLLAPRAPGESFSAAERRLLDNIARQAGAAVYAAQLTDHLQSSREQLVLTREEERRRLQRDLHDGLGPQLAALGMQIDVARGLATPESPEAAALLAHLSAETKAAIADIRRLVYDLRPPALDQLGLAGALREYAAGQSGAAGGTRITVDAPESLPPLPAAVEVAAYRIVQEAVANCLRHAGAATCRIVLRVDGGLRVEVIDDGRGLPSVVTSGVGLPSMRERAAELGGACRVDTLPGSGTQVIATFPLPETAHP